MLNADRNFGKRFGSELVVLIDSVSSYALLVLGILMVLYSGLVASAPIAISL